MHFITGVFFLAQRVRAQDAAMFSHSQLELVKKAYSDIADVFGVRHGTIAMLVRIGHGGEPSGRSSRRPPVCDGI